MSTKAKRITVQADVHAPLEKVWKAWSNPSDIMQWNQASDDWHTPESEVDFREGGSFRNLMAAKDGSASFNLKGTYTAIDPMEYIEFEMEDGRTVGISFSFEDGITNITETFEAENQHPAEMQQQGWQAILDNFKKYVEAN
jgi:uncharacterized protein YndB with AHSA1/START domain